MKLRTAKSTGLVVEALLTCALVYSVFFISRVYSYHASR